jgi:hypothetical protein
VDQHFDSQQGYGLIILVFLAAVAPISGYKCLDMAPASFPVRSPAIPLSKSPTSPAWLCSSEEAYLMAERVFAFKWKQRIQAPGPWHPLTVATLNNLIVTKIKLKHFDEAQRLCRDALDELRNHLPRQHPSCLCIQCSLSACLFLSNHIDEAEDLFDDLRHLTDSVTFEPAKGFFEVLVLVRLTRSDYLVLRDSEDGLQGLVPVEDYATQFECGVRHPTKATPKKTRRLVNYFESMIPGEVRGTVINKLFRSDFGSLRRKRSPNVQVAEQIKAKNGPSDLSTQARKIYGSLQAWPIIADTSAIPQLVLDTPHPLETPVIAVNDQQSALSDTTQRPAAAASSEHNSSAPVTMTSVDASLSHTEALDPSMGLTNRTNDSGYTASTDRSSVSKTCWQGSLKDLGANSWTQQRGSVPLQNKLDVVAWAADLVGDRVKEAIYALLDTGASCDCISEAFHDFIGAQLHGASTKVYIDVNGKNVRPLGYAWVGMKWKESTFGLSNRAKIKFHVVRNLPMDMLIGAETIQYHHLRDCVDVLAPIILARRTNKMKREDVRRRQQLKAAGAAEARRDAAQRKADRESLSRISDEDSTLVGGSETSRSRGSSPSTTNRTLSMSATSSSGAQG